MGRIGIGIIFLGLVAITMIPIFCAQESETDENDPPLAVIRSPVMQDVFNNREVIFFNGSESSDVDGDDLSFRWVLANKETINENATFELNASELGQGVHVISLYVSDGEYTDAVSISIYVKYHPDDVDTDQDGITDGEDEDDDNDGLTDEEENEMGTNPRLKDSDSDGVSDLLDPTPLNPGFPPPTTREENGPNIYWLLAIVPSMAIIGFLIFWTIRIARSKDD